MYIIIYIVYQMYYARHPFTTWISTLIVSKAPFLCFQDTVEKLAKEKIDDCMWVDLGSNAVIPMKKGVVLMSQAICDDRVHWVFLHKLLSMCLFKHFCSLVQ